MTIEGSESMSNCTTGCATQDHSTYAECLRSKRTRVAYCNSANNMDYSTQKKWDRDLAAYKDARAQGIQPSGTDRAAVDRAVAMSNEVGKAWDAS
jgi:hypothetical protein